MNVLFSPNLLTAKGAACWKNDFVAVELRTAPSHVTQSTAPGWPSSPNAFINRPVAGWSTSGPVAGVNLTYDAKTDTYIFLESHGEPGHSGTLMCSSTRVPIGVYFGVFGGKQGLRTRGVVVSIPPLVTLLRQPVDAVCPKHYCTRTGSPARSRTARRQDVVAGCVRRGCPCGKHAQAWQVGPGASVRPGSGLGLSVLGRRGREPGASVRWDARETGAA